MERKVHFVIPMSMKPPVCGAPGELDDTTLPEYVTCRRCLRWIEREDAKREEASDDGA